MPYPSGPPDGRPCWRERSAEAACDAHGSPTCDSPRTRTGITRTAATSIGTSKERDGLRIQIIWKISGSYGNHYHHVHIGAQRTGSAA